MTSPPGQNENVCNVLTLLSEASATPKLKWCRFFAITINSLRHFVRTRHLKFGSQATDAPRKLQTATSIMKPLSFLGRCNVFQRFVPYFARIAPSKYKRIRNDESAWFSLLYETELTALQTVKAALLKPPMLSLPNANGHLAMATDACNVQIKCVLRQKQADDTLEPIGYRSLSLNEVEWRDGTTQKEGLAIVCKILTLQPYLWGIRFTPRTDHESFKWILSL